MKFSALLNSPKILWRALYILPFAPFIFNALLILFFWFLCATSALAQTVPFTEPLPPAYYGDTGYTVPTYCLHTYDVLNSFNDEIYTCRIVKVHPVQVLAPGGYASSEVTPDVAGRHQCWASSYGGFYYGNSLQPFSGIILKSHIDFSMVPPPIDPNDEVCYKASDGAPELTCNINITSIINGAFSNKFPLDLFSGFNDTPQISACPQFTIEGQTFQLCYINQLVKVLKYVLLLVFIITSVVAL